MADILATSAVAHASGHWRADLADRQAHDAADRFGASGALSHAVIEHAANEQGRCHAVAIELTTVVPTVMTDGTANFWAYSPTFGKAYHSQDWNVTI